MKPSEKKIEADTIADGIFDNDVIQVNLGKRSKEPEGESVQKRQKVETSQPQDIIDER